MGAARERAEFQFGVKLHADAQGRRQDNCRAWMSWSPAAKKAAFFSAVQNAAHGPLRHYAAPNNNGASGVSTDIDRHRC